MHRSYSSYTGHTLGFVYIVLDGASFNSLGFFARIFGDIAQGNMVVLTDEDTDEAGRRLCSSGADIQSRSTPGDRSLFNLPNVPVDRQYLLAPTPHLLVLRPF